jgi:hypothetical protein
MTCRSAGALLAALLSSAAGVTAQELRAGVDPRVELMSILFRLGGAAEYNRCRIPQYDQAIERYFAPYRGHQAVRLANSLGVGLDAPMKLAVNVRDADSLDELIALDGAKVHLYENWDAAKARDFLAAARGFSADAHFGDFVKSQQALYDVVNARLGAYLEKADPAWFGQFFGPPAPARLAVIPGLANGAPSYAARVIDEAGAEEVCAIPGVAKVDAQGLPVFDASWGVTMAHEVAHLYADRAISKNAAQLQKAGAQLYEPVAEAMQQQSYGNWKTMLSESLARAAAIEYVMAHDGQAAGRAVIREDNARSFFWMNGLVNTLETYRSQRQQYPTFDSYMPRVVDYFIGVAPRIPAIVDRMRPKVVSTSVANGARSVDPSLKSIVVRFSIAMTRVGPGKTSKTAGGRFDAAGLAVTIPVTLEPDRDYALPLRWAGGQAFLSADGVPLPATTLHFHTAAGPASK